MDIYMIINVSIQIHNKYETVKCRIGSTQFSFIKPSKFSKVLYMVCEDAYAWHYLNFNHKSIQRFSYM